ALDQPPDRAQRNAELQQLRRRRPGQVGRPVGDNGRQLSRTGFDHAHVDECLIGNARSQWRVQMNEFPAPPTMPMTSTTPARPAPPATPASPPVSQPWFTSRERHGERNGAVVFGILLVVVGSWLLLRQFFPVFDL